MAARLLGTTGAVVTAIAAGSYTYALWGHPYALLIFTAEAYIVSLLLKRISNLALADLVYWLAIGMPLIWVCYEHMMQMNITQVNLILLKQPINGLVNAILATFILYGLASHRIIRQQPDDKTIQLPDLIFTLLLTFSILPTLIIIHHHNETQRENQLQNLQEKLLSQAQFMALKLPNSPDPAKIEQTYQTLAQSYPKPSLLQNFLILKDQQVLISTLPKELTENFLSYYTSKSHDSDELHLYKPVGRKLPSMLEWHESMYYVRHSNAPDHELAIFVLQDSSKIADTLQSNTHTAFLVLFLVILIASGTAFFISRVLTSSITQLSRLTKDLPRKLHRHDRIVWPNSRIMEIDQLSQQISIMAKNIGENFSDITNRSEAIIDQSKDAIITVDNKGLIRGFNQAAQRQFKYRLDQVFGEPIGTLFPDRFHEELTKFFSNPDSVALPQVAPSRYELHAIRSDGSEYPIELSVTTISQRGETTYTGFVSDISERKANEQLKSDFISTISHELRTPLTSIKGAVKLIATTGKSMAEDNFTQLMEVTDRNVDRLSNLINDILDFDKLQSDQFNYQLETVKISTLVAAIIEETKPFAEQANISLQYHSHTHDHVLVDPMRFTQILKNLLSNAIKFSDAGDIVTIQCEQDEQHIRVSVIDRGKGISAAFTDKIFERFTQQDATDARAVQRGTGLGLAIAKRMTLGMGGSIDFHSVEGEGSTFYLLFPRTPALTSRVADHTVT